MVRRPEHKGVMLNEAAAIYSAVQLIASRIPAGSLRKILRATYSQYVVENVLFTLRRCSNQDTLWINKKGPPNGGPCFVNKWRARHDSNVRPPGS